MILLISNVPPGSASDIANVLVREGLAACVTETPVKSTYLWGGELHRDDEITLTLKVSESVVEKTMMRLKELHPFEVPEILALRVEEKYTHTPYVNWVNEVCNHSNKDESLKG